MESSIPGISNKRMKKISNRLMHNIYFNKKYRDGVKKDFQELLDMGLKNLELSQNPRTIKEGEDRIVRESMIDVGVKYLDTVKDAEKRQCRMNQYGKFTLYKKGNTYIYQMETLRGNKIRHGVLVFKDGLPVRGDANAYREFLKFNSKGFEKLDWGKMHLKQTDFEKGYYHFWGKKKKTFYNLKYISWTKKRLYYKVIKA